MRGRVQCILFICKYKSVTVRTKCDIFIWSDDAHIRWEHQVSAMVKKAQELCAGAARKKAGAKTKV